MLHENSTNTLRYGLWGAIAGGLAVCIVVANRPPMVTAPSFLDSNSTAAVAVETGEFVDPYIQPVTYTEVQPDENFSASVDVEPAHLPDEVINRDYEPLPDTAVPSSEQIVGEPTAAKAALVSPAQAADRASGFLLDESQTPHLATIARSSNFAAVQQVSYEAAETENTPSAYAEAPSAYGEAVGIQDVPQFASAETIEQPQRSVPPVDSHNTRSDSNVSKTCVFRDDSNSRVLTLKVNGEVQSERLSAEELRIAQQGAKRRSARLKSGINPAHLLAKETSAETNEAPKTKVTSETETAPRLVIDTNPVTGALKIDAAHVSVSELLFQLAEQTEQDIHVSASVVGAISAQVESANVTAALQRLLEPFGFVVAERPDAIIVRTADENRTVSIATRLRRSRPMTPSQPARPLPSAVVAATPGHYAPRQQPDQMQSVQTQQPQAMPVETIPQLQPVPTEELRRLAPINNVASDYPSTNAMPLTPVEQRPMVQQPVAQVAAAAPPRAMPVASTIVAPPAIQQASVSQPAVSNERPASAAVAMQADPVSEDLVPPPVRPEEPINPFANHPDAVRLCLIAERAMEAGNFVGAADMLAEATVQYPNSALVYRTLGEIYSLRDEPEAAFHALSRSLELNKFDSVTNYLFGRLLLKMGNTTRGTHYILQAQSLEPNS